MFNCNTPTGKEFVFSMNFNMQIITVTAESGFQFDYHLSALKDLLF